MPKISRKGGQASRSILSIREVKDRGGISRISVFPNGCFCIFVRLVSTKILLY